MSAGLRFSVKAIKQHVVHPLVVAPDRVAGMDAALAGGGDHLARGAADPDGELLEARPLREDERQPEPLLRIRDEPHAGLSHLAQALRPEPREVHEPGEREQGLVRRDVRRRLLAADVLLAGLEREHVAALAVQVGRLTDDAARQPADVVDLRREEAVVRPGVGLVVARALALADRHRAAVVSGRLEHAERDRIDVRDRHCAGVVRGRREVGGGLEQAEDVRLLEDHGGRV